MLKVNYKITRMTSLISVVLVSLILTLNRFHCYEVSIVNFEQVNAGWEVPTSEGKTTI